MGKARVAVTWDHKQHFQNAANKRQKGRTAGSKRSNMQHDPQSMEFEKVRA